MKYNMLGLVLALALLWAVPDGASGQSMESIDVARHRFETTLIVQVLPLQAEVVVDGRPLGAARELVASAISVTPGTHTIEVRAPGFHRYVGEFTADSVSSVNQFVVTLAPE